MWILRTTGDAPERTFRLLSDTFKTVGRSTGADFIVDAPLVSRLHCRVTALPSGELEVTDLESANGTFVNGARVTTARLASGDRLGVGRTEILAIKDNDIR